MYKRKKPFLYRHPKFPLAISIFSLIVSIVTMIFILFVNM